MFLTLFFRFLNMCIISGYYYYTRPTTSTLLVKLPRLSPKSHAISLRKIYPPNSPNPWDPGIRPIPRVKHGFNTNCRRPLVRSWAFRRKPRPSCGFPGIPFDWHWIPPNHKIATTRTLRDCAFGPWNLRRIAMRTAPIRNKPCWPNANGNPCKPF